MTKKHNRSFFGLFKFGTKMVRDHCSDDPFEKIKETGVAGKAIGKCGDKLIKTPIHKASYALTGLTYNRKRDNPCKGRAIYTIWHMSLKTIAKLVLGILLSLSVLGHFTSILGADFMTQLRMSSGLILLFLFGYGIHRIEKWLKKIFR